MKVVSRNDALFVFPVRLALPGLQSASTLRRLTFTTMVNCEALEPDLTAHGIGTYVS